MKTIYLATGPFFMVCAAVLFTAMTLQVKLMPDHYTVWHLGFVRCFGGAWILVLFFSRLKNPFKGSNVPLLMLRGCTGSAAFFCAVTAVRTLPVSTAVVLFYSFPAFAALFGRLIYKERLNRLQIACIATLMVGVAVLFDFKGEGNLFGQSMAIAGAGFAGMTVTLIRSLRENNGPVIIYFYFCMMGTLVTLPKCIAVPVLPLSVMEWGMISGIIVTSVAGQLCMNQGFFYCKGFEGAAYMSSETVFVALAGIVFLHDPVSWQFFLGSFLIMGSGLTIHWLGQAGKHEKHT